MSATLIYEVRQRSAVALGVERELGFAPDPNMAEMIVDACYRKMWSLIALPDFVPDEWFDLALRDRVMLDGIDTFTSTDKRTDFPLFSVVAHIVWNQVPFMDDDFVFNIIGVNPF